MAAGAASAAFLPSVPSALAALAGSGTRPAGAGGFACGRIPGTSFDLHGPVRGYLDGVTAHWLHTAPESNPAMLEMFRDRDRLPLRDMVPWAGEFAGKYLVSAVQVWRVTGDPALRARIADFVARLVALQADDGYLGPWPKDSRLTGHAPNAGPKGGDTWDAWGHYHVQLGLLLWHDETGDALALDAARRIGDLFCTRFEGNRLVDTGSTEMNLAPIHGLCLLYRKTRDPRHLAMARRICDEFAARGADGKPLAGDYLESALAGKEFFQMPKPRWESLHPILGLAELHRITGEERYRTAFTRIWWSIAKLDRHNNGGFSSGEQAQGNPYHRGAIETCCTIAWTALGVAMLEMTGDPVVADELELSTLNSILGLHSPNGRWVTYNTPMDGTRLASAHDIVFQARAGSPELNCCSVNGARGLGLIGDWAVLGAGDGLLVNWYGEGTVQTRLPDGTKVTITQSTRYPADGRVSLRISSSRRKRFPVSLRIPHWSEKTSVTIAGRPGPAATPGSYLRLDRTWGRGETVVLEFDFRPRFWRGERESAGTSSVFRGPLLLAYDRRHNAMDPADLPELDAASMDLRPVAAEGWMPPILLLEATAVDGRKVRLCDFATAGVGGSPYRSWLRIRSAPAAEFSRSNPLRTARFG